MTTLNIVLLIYGQYMLIHQTLDLSKTVQLLETKLFYKFTNNHKEPHLFQIIDNYKCLAWPGVLLEYLT